MTSTALYRHFDASGVLLYVGISLSAVQRLSQHKQTASWFQRIARVDIEWYPTREAALSAERQAIAQEDPLHNLARPSHSAHVRAAIGTAQPRAWAIVHVGSGRRDGNYFGYDVATEMLGWWRETYADQCFELLPVVNASVSSTHVLRASEESIWRRVA